MYKSPVDLLAKDRSRWVNSGANYCQPMVCGGAPAMPICGGGVYVWWRGEGFHISISSGVAVILEDNRSI